MLCFCRYGEGQQDRAEGENQRPQEGLEELAGDLAVGQQARVVRYAPYEQSKRRDIYRSFAAKLLTKGLAYPCFLTEDEIADIRKKQEENKQNTGIYGEYALYRNLKEEEAVKKIEPDRLGSPYDPTRRFERALPDLAGEIGLLLDENLEVCARGLFDVARRELEPGWTEFPSAAADTIARRLGWDFYPTRCDDVP